MATSAPNKQYVSMSYEHRKGGKIISRGRQKVDNKRGRITCIQEDVRGRKVSRLCFDLEGNLIERVDGRRSITGVLLDYLKEAKRWLQLLLNTAS